MPGAYWTLIERCSIASGQSTTTSGHRVKSGSKPFNHTSVAVFFSIRRTRTLAGFSSAAAPSPPPQPCLLAVSCPRSRASSPSHARAAVPPRRLAPTQLRLLAVSRAAAAVPHVTASIPRAAVALPRSRAAAALPLAAPPPAVRAASPPRARPSSSAAVVVPPTVAPYDLTLTVTTSLTFSGRSPAKVFRTSLTP
jgi:hypothetical protein